jgi:hypothetical protein
MRFSRSSPIIYYYEVERQNLKIVLYSDTGYACRLLKIGDDMKQTQAGLPNSCWKCGADNLEHWYAIDDETAAAGKGICEACFNPAPVVEEQPAPEVKPARRGRKTG